MSFLVSPIYVEWSFPLLSIGPVQFRFKGCWMVFFIFIQNFNRTFCKQAVKTLIRRHVVWRLIWVFTVCLCPTKRTLGLYGLTIILLRKGDLVTLVNIYCGCLMGLYFFPTMPWVGLQSVIVAFLDHCPF